MPKSVKRSVAIGRWDSLTVLYVTQYYYITLKLQNFFNFSQFILFVKLSIVDLNESRLRPGRRDWGRPRSTMRSRR